MSIALSQAVIYGSDNFVANKLGDLLVSRGISVLWDDDEAEGKPLYFFDFGNGNVRYKEMFAKNVKVCVVEMADPPSLGSYGEAKQDWTGDIRKVRLHNVYGEGMPSNWFLGEAVELAARNKNLVLPPVTETYRLLSVTDATEAIMRAVIISGTAGKTFEIAGQETNSREVAQALIDLAKMTKVEVRENLEFQISNLETEEKYENSAKVLRWKPIEEFREGIKPVVAEFVARVDEEARNKSKLRIKNYELGIEDEDKKDQRGMMKVEIEDEIQEKHVVKVLPEREVMIEENDQLPINNYQLKEKHKEIIEDKEPEVIIKEREIIVSEDEEEEEKVVGKKINWKNYQLPITNYQLRPQEKIDQISDVRSQKEENLETKKIIEEVVEDPPSQKSFGEAAEKPIKKMVFPWKKIVMMVLGIVVVVGLMLGWMVWGVVNPALSLQKPIKLLEEKKIDEARKLVEKYRARNESVAWFWEGSQLGEIGKITEEVLETELKLCNLAESMDKVNGAVFEEKVVDFKQILANISLDLAEVETDVGVIGARLASVRSWMPGRWKPEVDKAADLILKNIDLIRKARELTGVLPEILGLDGKRRDYMVLLQNEMEIRATGGFIGSYGILSFQDGRLLSFDIKDVYEADGQLKGHVEPPEEIKRYLGEAAWFMRDSNWKASFPEAAKDIQWFLEKETNRKVDGVIGMDLAVAKSILNATGPIYVPDFKEEVDKDNLYEQAEFYSESKFFPGSVQKASFLSGLGKQLFAEISNLKTGQRWTMLMGMIETLEKNDLQMVINEPVTAQVISDLGWDGEIFGGRCGIADCYTDYLYMVESNLGVNKANYFLYRSIEQKIDIKESNIERTLRINYENLAKNNSWPGGDYKNYLRVYLPKDVQVSEVSITMDGQKQNIALDQVKMVNVYEKRELGLLVMVPVSKKVIVEIRYGSSMPQIRDKFSYLLYVQRQPGFGDTGIVNLVSIPNGYQPMQVSSSASVVGGKLLFNQKLDRDLKLGVEINK